MAARMDAAVPSSGPLTAIHSMGVRLHVAHVGAGKGPGRGMQGGEKAGWPRSIASLRTWDAEGLRGCGVCGLLAVMCGVGMCPGVGFWEGEARGSAAYKEAVKAHGFGMWLFFI